MTESASYKNFRANVIKQGDRIDRVENIRIVGMPDINGCIDGVEFWIEMKAPKKEPKRPTTPLLGSAHNLSQDQINWFDRQRRAAGNAYLLIVTDRRWLLLGGSFASIVNKMTVAQMIDNAVFTAEKPVNKELWGFLRTALARKVQP